MSRQIIASLFALFAVAHAGAVTPRDEPASPKDVTQARNYARQVLTVTRMVAERYVRPASQTDLVEAALTGLFEAARRPLPAGLRTDLSRAAEEQDLFGYVARQRASLGNEATLAGDRDFIASVNALAAALDPYCGLVASPAGRLVDEGDTRELGIELDGGPSAPRHGPAIDPRDNASDFASALPLPLRVREVKPGSPAQRAGVRPDDIVTHVRRKAVTPDNAAAAFHEIVAPEHGEAHPLELTLRRSARGSPLMVRLTKEVYQPESVFGVRRTAANEWDPWIDREGKFAYLRLGFLDLNTPASLVNALSIAEQGGMRGLILDLRWCPGGYLTPAAAVAAIFLPQGVVAGTKYRDPAAAVRTFVADDPVFGRFKAGNYPILVLVNGDTSGGGELIAAALQDHKRAAVAGQRTLGKASIQSAIYLPDLRGLSFRLSSGMFTRPSAKELHRFPDSSAANDWGVRPDPGLQLPASPELRHWLKEQTVLFTLRPGGSREAYPLDDPDADSQRKAALSLLRSMVRDAEPR